MHDERFGPIVRTIPSGKAKCGLDVFLKPVSIRVLSAPQLFTRFGSPQKPVSGAQDVASLLSPAQRLSKTKGLMCQTC